MQFTITFDTYIIGFILIIFSVILLIINWIFRDNFYFRITKGSLRPMEEPMFFHKDEFYRNSIFIIGLLLLGVMLMIWSNC